MNFAEHGKFARGFLECPCCAAKCFYIATGSPRINPATDPAGRHVVDRPRTVYLVLHTKQEARLCRRLQGRLREDSGTHVAVGKFQRVGGRGRMASRARERRLHVPGHDHENMWRMSIHGPSAVPAGGTPLRYRVLFLHFPATVRHEVSMCVHVFAHRVPQANPITKHLCYRFGDFAERGSLSGKTVGYEALLATCALGRQVRPHQISEQSFAQSSGVTCLRRRGASRGAHHTKCVLNRLRAPSHERGIPHVDHRSAWVVITGKKRSPVCR